MICEERWQNLPKVMRRRMLAEGYTFIPSNQYGIEPGSYSSRDLITILRRRKAEKSVVQFILDMLE